MVCFCVWGGVFGEVACGCFVVDSYVGLITFLS